MEMKKIYTGEERKAQLLDVGARLAAKLGVVNVQRQVVAEKAGCAASLVSAYMGDTLAAQAKYKRHMKKLGLVEPSKEKIERIGKEQRMHKIDDKRRTRKRSPKEVEAIKRKRADAPNERKPAAPAVRRLPKPAVAPAQQPPQRKSAARPPMKPPLRVLPLEPVELAPPLAGAFP
jgi:hypothetical protein